MSRQSLPVGGIPSTALWTLYCRASHPSILVDPQAQRILEALDLDLRRWFGRPDPSFARRARAFDELVAAFLRSEPGAPVVSLGEGLETQRFRVGGWSRWTTVDLPDMISLRERFIVPTPSALHRTGSVENLGWLEDLQDRPACVVAQGLFMYLPESSVKAVLQGWAERARGCFVFDVVPPWVSWLTRVRVPLTPAYRLPVMPWGAGRGGVHARLGAWLGHRVQLRWIPISLPSGPMPWSLSTGIACLTRNEDAPVDPKPTPSQASRPPAD